ncbi:signal peptide-containing protein [Acinetobacter sp. ANC 4558]|uniref:lipase family protein n=1 Tax=Acinetobacter sp. ANC 4558 TaxID=1977876 RepID=UPI000A33B86C|nr:lipase family protein [Acinetobacter sp. ANC 4558]OTG84148.1 signal peptide-containing protein [Acinetobacter sp. ANC 4558]
MKSRILNAAVVLSLLVSLPFAQAKVYPDNLVGDSYLSDFYEWNQEIPKASGTLLRIEPLTPSYIGQNKASAQYRILYSSTSGVDASKASVVSGALFIPKGTPPKGGWPLLVWGHGTVGLADTCAPSWSGRLYIGVEHLDKWLSEGFAVIAPDYEGLGTQGAHWLINNPMLAYNMLDGATAAINAQVNIANKVILSGESQGGAGAFAAAAYAPSYAPKLNIKGTVATGVIYRDKNAKQQEVIRSNPHEVVTAIALPMYSFIAAQSYNPKLKPEDVFTEKALPFVERARNTCIITLQRDVTSAGLTFANALKEKPSEAYTKTVEEMQEKFGYFPTLKINHPVFIATGANDKTPDVRGQLKLMKDSCQAGTTIEGHIYAGYGHSDAVPISMKDAVPFAKKVLADQKIKSICQPILE